MRISVSVRGLLGGDDGGKLVKGLIHVRHAAHLQHECSHLSTPHLDHTCLTHESFTGDQGGEGKMGRQ